jgi:hypothetical protein
VYVFAQVFLLVLYLSAKTGWQRRDRVLPD